MSISTVGVTSTYKWRIDNFSQRISEVETGGSIVSDFFSLDRQAKFLMRFCNRGFGSCYLDLICKDFGRNRQMKINVTSWRENTNGEIGNKTEMKLMLNGDAHSVNLNWHNIWAMKCLAKDDSLFICCEIKYENSINEAGNFDFGYDINESDARSEFGKNMLDFYSAGYSDLTIRIQVEDKEFKASKFVLMSCSKIFKQMLSCPDSIEAQTGVIKMEDTKPEIIDALIRWIYQVKIDNIDEICMDLYRMADKYDIDCLKKKCIKAMADSLSNENFPDRLILAYKFDEEALKKYILNFIKEDKERTEKIKFLMGADVWFYVAIIDPELRKKVLDDIYG